MARYSVSNDEHCRDHGISQPPSSHLGIKILRTDLAETSLDIVGLTIQLRELPQASTKVSNSDVASGDIVQYYEQDSRSHNSAPIYRELYDSASSIVTEILRQPRLIVESVASIAYNGSSSSSASQSIVAFIAMNRILHPYFTNSSSTTSLLIEAIIHQSEQSRCMQYDNADEDDCRRIVASLFIQHVKIWSPLVHPLPVTPNVKSETFLTTILKLYAVRVDVTAFFRNLWSPVLPSVVAIVNNLNDNVERGVSCNLKNIVKVAMRLLSHTFSEKSITSFPSPAVAVCRAIYTLCGNTGVYIYLFDLLVLPNLVKILSLSEYDNVGSSVMKQFHTYYTQKSWWFDSNHCTEYNPVSSLIWITWKLFTGAVHTDDTLLSVLSSRDFFSDGPILDIRSMPDQRLRNVLSLLKRSLNKSWQLLLHLPLDEKGCEIFDTDATSATTNLKIALPHLAQDLNRRLDTLFEKPTEIIGALVISRYEASTFFDAVSAAVSNCRKIDGKEETEKERNKNQSKSLLREEIASYHLLEGVINETVPLSLRPTSEQMVLHILSESPVSVSPDKDVGHLHKQLSRGLLLAKSYEKVLRSTLSRLQEGRINRVEDLIDQEFKLISSPLTFSPSSSSNMGAQNTDIFYQNDKFQDFHQSPTHTSALKVLNPHRGVVPVIRAVDCMTQQRIEDEEFVQNKAIRLLKIARDSRVISPYTGSIYTKVDENLLYGRLLDDTKSRMHQPRTDDSSMTSKDLEDQFNSSLRRYSRSKKNDNRVDSFGNIRSKFETKTSKSVVDISQSTFSTSQSSLNRQAANASLSRNSGGNIQKIGHVNKSDLIPSESIEWMERSSKRNSSSSVKSKRSDSIVKPFPEHLRVKLRTRPDGAALNKEFAPPFMSSEQDESDRDHLNDNRSLAKPHGVYKDVASSLLDSPNYEKALYVPQYAYNDEGEGDRYDKIDPSSLAKQKVMYQNFDGKILDNLRQSGHDHEYHSSFGRERRVNEADSGRNLEDELDNYCYYQQNDRTSDSLSSAEHLEAMSGSHSTPTNVHAYPYAFSRPSSRDGISNRSGTSIPQGSRVSNGYLESELEMHQNAPFLPYSSESHLGRLEGRLLSRTKSFENRLSASLADVGRSPSPLFKQPPFRPWGQGRDFSPEKRRGRTFSNSYIFDSTRRGSAAGRLSHRPQSAPSGNRTGMSESRSERGRQEGYLNGRFDELHVSESKSKYLHQNQATKDMPYNDPTHFRRGPLDGSKAGAISPSFSSPIERTMSNDYPVMSRYGLFSRPLSAGSQSMLGPRSRSSEMRGAEEYPVRGRTEERQLQPLRPTLQRRPNARLIAGHRPSASPSSSLSETPSKFLRDLHAGVTPGLRETEIIVNSNATETERKRERSNSRGKERSRPVFRPGGTVRDVSLQDYDDRIIEHLNTAYKDAMKSNSPQSRASNLSCDVRERGLRHSSPSCVDNGDPPNPPPDNDLMHNQHYQNGSNERVDIFHDEEIDVDHSDIRAAAMEVMMNMSFTLTPSLDHEQLTDDAEDIDEIISRDGQDVEDVEWVVEKDAVERNEREEGDKGEIFTHIIDEGSSLDDRFVCYPERNDATVSHPRPSASYRPVISSTFPNSTQKNDFHHPINSEEQVEAVSIENEQIPQNSSTLAVLMDDVQLNEVPKTQRSKCRATLNAVSEPKSMTVDDTLGTLPSKGDIKLSDNQMIRLPLDSKLTVRSTGMSRPTVPLKFKAEHDPVSNSIVDPDPILPLGVNPFARIPVQADLKEQSLPDVHTPKGEILSVPRADSYPKEIPRDVSTLGPHVVPPASFGLEMLKKGVLVKKRGTRGRPKLKVLKYVESSSTIQWASMATIEPADPQGTAWYSQVFNCSPSKRCKTSSLPISSITYIFDRESKDLKVDSIRRQVLNLSSNCCLLVTKERTLDLTFKNNRIMTIITSALKDLIKS